MNKNTLIKLLNSYCRNISIDSSFISGYTDNEIEKIERLYDIKVAGQLYEFLNCMGRCSGGFFGMNL